MSLAPYPPCKPKRAANDSGPRQPGWIRHVVLHSTEGGTAASVARYFATTARASTQLVIDDRECYRCVPDLVIPWGAPGVNRSGLHIEHCGWARWTPAEWLQRKTMLDRSAYRAAVWSWTYGIPRNLLTVAQAKLGKSGFVTHAVASKAFPPNSGHHDPGDGFPFSFYMSRVNHYYAELEAERTER